MKARSVSRLVAEGFRNNLLSAHGSLLSPFHVAEQRRQAFGPWGVPDLIPSVLVPFPRRFKAKGRVRLLRSPIPALQGAE